MISSEFDTCDLHTFFFGNYVLHNMEVKQTSSDNRGRFKVVSACLLMQN